MKRMKRVLAVVIALSVISGYFSVRTEKTVSAAKADKNITVKVTSDYTLKLPGSWKGNYIMKRNGKNSVSFYAKKCYKQKKEGWLFSIEKCKDEPYEDAPSYELVGRWGGYDYVAMYPTDVQSEGVTKAAKKQYTKLNQSVEKIVKSIRPTKGLKKKKKYFCASNFAVKIPANWKGKYIVKKSKKKSRSPYVTFYEKKCYKQKKGGWLFSIECYKDNSYLDLPSYDLVAKWGGRSYVAVYPTDVQFEGATKSAAKQYRKMSKDVEKIAKSIQALK